MTSKKQLYTLDTLKEISLLKLTTFLILYYFLYHKNTQVKTHKSRLFPRIKKKLTE